MSGSAGRVAARKARTQMATYPHFFVISCDISFALEHLCSFDKHANRIAGFV